MKSHNNHTKKLNLQFLILKHPKKQTKISKIEQFGTSTSATVHCCHVHATHPFFAGGHTEEPIHSVNVTNVAELDAPPAQLLVLNQWFMYNKNLDFHVLGCIPFKSKAMKVLIFFWTFLI